MSNVLYFLFCYLTGTKFKLNLQRLVIHIYIQNTICTLKININFCLQRQLFYINSSTLTKTRTIASTYNDKKTKWMMKWALIWMNHVLYWWVHPNDIIQNCSTWSLKKKTYWSISLHGQLTSEWDSHFNKFWPKWEA